MGGAWNWEDEYFSMDETRSLCVQRAIIRLFDDGLIFRDNRMVNWCCALRTAISDIEVEHVDIKSPTKMKLPGGRTVEVGVMYHFAYPVVNDHDEIIGELTVATTRLETMLGDVAVAVHPDDERYKVSSFSFELCDEIGVSREKS
jgi:valyl-tRNA synthetase